MLLQSGLEFDLAQALGFVSFALGISTFFQKNDRRLKIIMLIYNANHFVHFLLLGSLTSAASTALSAIRTASSIYTSSKYVCAVFILAGIALGGYLAEGPWDLLPILGACIGSYAVFMLEGIKMRLAFLAGAMCWCLNNYIVGSIGGFMLESTLICVNISTIYRLYRDNKRQITVS